MKGITSIYENAFYAVIANPYEDCYYIVNKRTDISEAVEKAAPTACFRADALEKVTLKHKEVIVEKDATI